MSHRSILLASISLSLLASPASRGVQAAESSRDLTLSYDGVLLVKVLDVQLVNRVAESWYVFADLHWTVQERAGARRILHFCTAETSPLDSQGRYWVRTGSGTDPVEI